MTYKLILITMIIVVAIGITISTIIKVSYGQQLSNMSAFEYQGQVNIEIDKELISMLFGIREHGDDISDTTFDRAENITLDCISQGLAANNDIGNDTMHNVTLTKSANGNITKDLMNRLPACYEGDRFGNNIMLGKVQ